MPPTKRTCPAGHTYQKSSDCPVCPICERDRVPADAFLSMFGGPARRALENAGITTVSRLAEVDEDYLLSLHGFGKASLPVVRQITGKG